MTEASGARTQLPAGMRYWRKTRLPDQWWPWGVLPIAGLLLLFLMGLFGIAPQIQADTEKSVRDALAEFGLDNAVVQANGQTITVDIKAPPGAEAQVRAIAAAAACESWAGDFVCATKVRVNRITDDPFPGNPRLDIELPKVAEAPSTASFKPSGPAPTENHHPHDFNFIREGKGIVLRGDVSSEQARQRLIQRARTRYERVTPELEITGKPASPDFERATERAFEVLENANTGVAQWQDGQLSVVVESAPVLHDEIRAAFNRSESAPPLGGISLKAGRPAPSSPEQLSCKVAFATLLGEEPIAFETGSTVMTSESRTLIESLVGIAQRCPGRIVVEGHTDNVGLEENNRQLSLERAQTVVRAMVEEGVEASRIRARGLGESQPVADNNRAEGRALNRRIVMSLLPPPPRLTGSCEDQVATLMQSGRMAFDVGSTNLDEESRELIDRLVTVLRPCPGQVVVESHTDNAGLQDNNRRLSVERAEAVKAALVNRGLPDARVSALGLGEDLPVVSNDTEAGREQNRRIAIRLLSAETAPGSAGCNARAESILAEQGIEFRTGSHYITDESQPVVSRLAQLLVGCQAEAVVAGHTDDTGDEAANQRLSWRRANAVKQGLLERGVNPGKVHAVGYGESRPAHDNNSEAGRALNRRIEVHVETDIEASVAQARCNDQLNALLADAGLQFATGSARLSDESRAVAESAAGILASCPANVMVEGHTDDVGDEDNNQHLSWRRARAVREALVEAGIAEGRIRAVGFGESRPRVPNETEEGRRRNRRISIHVED